MFPSLRLPLLQPNILTAKHGNGSQSAPMVTGNPFCHIYGFHVSCSCLQSRRARFQSINITSKKQLVGKVSGGNFMRFRTGCQKLGEFDWQICGLLFHLLKLCLLDFGGCNFSQVSSWKLVLQEHPACRWQSSQNTSPTASARFLQRNTVSWCHHNGESLENPQKNLQKILEAQEPLLCDCQSDLGPTTTISSMDHGSLFGNVISFFGPKINDPKNMIL